eukprot:g7204.t1
MSSRFSHFAYAAALFGGAPTGAVNPKPTYDAPWPAFHDRGDADFVEDTEADNGFWATQSHLRHGIEHAKENAIQAKAAVAVPRLEWRKTAETAEGKRRTKEEVEAELREWKAKEDAEFERLVEIKKQSYDEEQVLKEKKQVVEEMARQQREKERELLERKKRMEAEMEKAKREMKAAVEKGEKEVEQAEKNFAEVERMIKSSKEYETASKQLDET